MTVAIAKQNNNRKVGFIFVSASLAALFAITLVTSSAIADTNPISENAPAREFVGSNWLNTPDGKSEMLSDLKGKVGIVHFWTLGCINCKHNLPAYNRWAKKFAGQPVGIIGVHTPETPGERNLAHVKQAVRRWGITYPVLVDSNASNWSRWNQQFWPTVYLIDKHGKIRYRWEGELEFNNAGGEAKMSALVEKLLREG